MHARVTWKNKCVTLVQVWKERDAAAKAADTAAGEEQDLWKIEMMSCFGGDIVRLRHHSTLYSYREFNPLVSIDFVDLSLPTCLLLQIHNGEGYDLMVTAPCTFLAKP